MYKECESFFLDTCVKIVKIKSTCLFILRFLLAQLHFESLIGRRSAKSVRMALRDLSQGSSEYAYDDAYAKAMKRIQGQFKEQSELAIQTLSWLTCARRPLHSLELRHALAIEREEPALDEENIPEIEDIIAVCAGLVTIENESGIIRLVHYTTREYLERKKSSIFQNAETEISSLCVTYVSFDVFGSGSCKSDKAFEERLKSYPFYSYAADHWGHHVRMTGDLQPGVIEFLKDQSKVEAAVQARCVQWRHFPKNWSQEFPNGMTGFHLAALFGIEEAVTYFLEHRYPVDQSQKNGWTPLMYAISYDQLNVTRLLLSHGANPNGTTDDDITPLSIAAKSGQNIAVRLLLEKGADVDGPCGGWDGTAMIGACESGQLETVEILLQNNANINAESEMYASPLEAAAQAGHWEVVTFLLDKGAAPDSQNDGMETALQAAAYQDRKDMVLTLLNYHADVNRQGGMWGTALIAACVGQHEEIVRLLLDNGADINVKSGGSGTALQAASVHGDQKLVKLLLENGANVNAEHEPYGTALIAAAAKGEIDTVKLLLDNGADIHGRGRLHGTALHAAAMFGNAPLVQVLLARGADSTIRAGVYKTPLRAATARGHQGVASLLKTQGQHLRV
jgi:ankyrin repeat protein